LSFEDIFNTLDLHRVHSIRQVAIPGTLALPERILDLTPELFWIHASARASFYG
jgi:hypothetical protein